jgi:hypothetical protein
VTCTGGTPTGCKECGMDPHEPTCNTGRREQSRSRAVEVARKLTDEQLVKCAEEAAGKILELVMNGPIDRDYKEDRAFEVEVILLACAARTRTLWEWQGVINEYVRKLNKANQELEEMRRRR